MPVASPCVRNCCLDDQDICLGCGRSLVEITGWSAAADVRKQEILLEAAARLRLRKQACTIPDTEVKNENR